MVKNLNPEQWEIDFDAYWEKISCLTELPCGDGWEEDREMIKIFIRQLAEKKLS